MSRVDNWSRAERDLYAIGSRATLDDLDRKIEEWRSSAALDNTSTDDMIREHILRMRKLDEQHKQWIARFLNGDGQADANADVAAGSHREEAASSDGTGHGDRQQPTNPWAAELERARAIASMPLDEYGRRRGELGIRSASNTGLFG